MRLQNTLFRLALLCPLLLCPGTTAAGDTHPIHEPVEYAIVVDQMIVNCEKKGCFSDSRLAQLQSCARRAASKAQFLENNRHDLIAGMTAAQLPLKRYRIERYVNARFVAFGDVEARATDNAHSPENAGE